jgi:hypothetical protein
MDKDDISFLKMGDIMRDNGKIIKWMEKDSHFLDKANCNILVNGRLINIMAGVFYILILNLM